MRLRDAAVARIFCSTPGPWSSFLQATPAPHPLEVSQPAEVQRLEPAPPFRRMLAFFLDLLAVIVIAQVGAAPIQLVLPPDSLSSMLPGLLFGVGLGFVYLGFATPLLGNSLGKWLFTLKIVGTHGRPISTAGWLGRLLVVGLWPINATMVLWSSTRRHLGDRLAQSIVVATAPKRNLLMAMAGAVVLVVCGFRVGGAAMTLGVLRSPAWQTARQYLAAQDPRETPATFPEGYQIIGDFAQFDAKVGTGYRRVKLSRQGSIWSVLSSDPLDDPSSGTQVRFDMTVSE